MGLFKRPTRQKKGRARLTPLPIGPTPSGPLNGPKTIMYQVQNMPYCLSTEQGRAQSYAHSEHGAFLVTEVEKALKQQKDETAEAVDEAIDEALFNLNPLTICSYNLLEEFSVFKLDLGTRDAIAFKPLYAAYSEERQMLLGNIATLEALVKDIKALVGIEEEQLDGNK